MPILLALLAAASPLEDANRLLAASKWDEAASAFSRIVDTDPANAKAWMGLGEAQLQRKDLPGAQRSFEKTLSLGFRPVLNQVNLARVRALEGDRDGVLSIFRALLKAGRGGQARAIIAGAPELAKDPGYARFAKEEMAPCRDSVYRQFDFWIGDWVVQDPAANPVGRNRVNLEQEGCLLVEHWTSGEGVQTGTSFNYYDVRDKKWHQLYIDNSGNAGAFPAMAGGLREGRMVLTTDPKEEPVSRWTWYEVGPGRVRQMAEQSRDGGKTWQVTWDSIYVK
ncbi:MAG TPA: tetratricopeptide repeat protein [Myxococcales bacterium]|nr:tetratricopeptide repeat protein [Myxococcales bacterium]